MPKTQEIVDDLTKLKDVASSGFALAFHINYTRPTFLFQTYPEEWISVYSEKGMVMSDPTVLWGFENSGTRRWSDLAAEDTAGVLRMAADYKMNYGVTCAVEQNGTRSIASFAREDREYSDAECTDLLGCTETIHKLTAGLDSLSPDLLAEIKKIGIQASQPGGR